MEEIMNKVQVRAAKMVTKGDKETVSMCFYSDLNCSNEISKYITRVYDWLESNRIYSFKKWRYQINWFPIERQHSLKLRKLTEMIRCKIMMTDKPRMQIKRLKLPLRAKKMTNASLKSTITRPHLKICHFRISFQTCSVSWAAIIHSNNTLEVTRSRREARSILRMTRRLAVRHWVSCKKTHL